MADDIKYPVGIQSFPEVVEGGYLYVDRFMRMLQTFLEGNPYGNTVMAQRETYFKNNIFIVLKALGFMPRVEEQTCRARMDVMLRTRRYIYIFELKTDGDAGNALRQIEDRGYALPYADEARIVVRVAANYSTKRNNIDSWIVMQFPPPTSSPVAK